VLGCQALLCCCLLPGSGCASPPAAPAHQLQARLGREPEGPQQLICKVLWNQPDQKVLTFAFILAFYSIVGPKRLSHPTTVNLFSLLWFSSLIKKKKKKKSFLCDMEEVFLRRLITFSDTCGQVLFSSSRISECSGAFFCGSLSKKPHVTLIYLKAAHAKPGAIQPCFACIICPVK